MLSYRHAFHAGNHGDVLKHTVLMRILAYMVAKDRPLLYLDTHAGAGYYELQGSMACKTNEAALGIGRLWQTTTKPPLVQPYLAALYAYNKTAALCWYPGSPLLVQHLLRQTDRAVCYELHSTDYPLLQNVLRTDPRFLAVSGDGLAGLRANLPPKERRGLILLDPSYEQDAEYSALSTAIKEAVQRFPTGVYILWYPLLPGSKITRFLQTLATIRTAKTLQVELIIATSSLRLGLSGSGLWIINPPWVLEAELREALPWLASQLGGANAAWRLNWIK